MNDFTGSLLDNLAIELPSWAFGNSGTRFKVFGTPGTPRTVREKIADAAVVHRLTGLAPTVALHIPWDTVDDYAALGAYAQELGVGLGTINSNTFQDDDYKFGSLTHTDKTVRQKAIDHHLACIEIMNQTGSRDLKIWLADGTNYPGQGDIRGRQERLAESLAADLPAHRAGSANGVGVQVLRTGDVHDRRAGLGHLLRSRQRARRACHGVPGHRSPRAGHQHRVHRRPIDAARKVGVLRFQFAVLRRRRPDRRRGGPVPAVPDHVRGRSAAAA